MSSLLLAALLALLCAGNADAQAGAPTLLERLGRPADARLLVIHADDLGMARSVDRASFEALARGWVTSASVMVPCPWFPEAARFAREHPAADLGLHLVLTSEWDAFRWGPVSPKDAVPSLLDEDGYFPRLEATVAERARPAEVERELKAQIAQARRAGLRPSHLDSHMGALFQTKELLEVYRGVAAGEDLPALIERLGTRGGEASPEAVAAQGEALVDRVIGIAPGVPAADWPQAYRRMLAPLPPGVYQLIVHLAYDDEEMRAAAGDHADWGAAWRQRDLDLVRSQAFRDFLRDQGFVLVGWKDLALARSRR